MTTPELLEFIRIEHALGMSLDEIVRLLVTDGDWDTTDVAEAFRALGLPEEAVRRYADRMAGISVPPVASSPKLAPAPVAQAAPVTRHAPAPIAAQGPAPMEYPKHAAPMHYVEKPEPKPQPTLARPATLLSQQSSRPLVRTSVSPVGASKTMKGPLVHVSKVAQPHAVVRAAAPVQPAPIPAPKPVAPPLAAAPAPAPKPIAPTEPLTTVPAPVAKPVEPLVTAPTPEAKPAGVAAHRTFINQKAAAAAIAEASAPKPLSKLAQAAFGITAPPVEAAPTPKGEGKTEPVRLADAKALGFDKEVHGTAPVFAAKHEVAPELPKQAVNPEPAVTRNPEEPKLVEKIPEPSKAPEQKVAPAPAVVSPLPPPAISPVPEMKAPPGISKVQEKKPEPIPVAKPEEPKLVEKISEPSKAPEQKVAPAPAVVSPLPPPPLPEPVPASVAAPTPTSAPIMPPGIPEGPPPIDEESNELEVSHPYFPTVPHPAPAPVATPAPVTVAAPAPAQQPVPQMPMQPIIINMPAYGMPGALPPNMPPQLAGMFQQMQMPPPPPTVVYQQIVQQQPVIPSGPPIVAEPINKPAEPKKPEPIRFDIGRVRDARKVDQITHGGRTTILNAISGMAPVESSSVEDVFRSQSGDYTEGGLSVEKSAVVHSMKVPHKRTMAGDLIRMQEGILPEQVVSRATDTHAISGVAMPALIATANEPTPEVDEVPPPPPQKKTGTLLAITLGIVGLFLFVGAMAYYVIVLRLPPAQDIFDGAVAQLVRAQGFGYDASLAIGATSTEAVPELLQANLTASGTVLVKRNALTDGEHAVKFDIVHEGSPFPLRLSFDGQARVIGDDVYLLQHTPTLDTPLENTLAPEAWARIPYAQLGQSFGLTGTSSVPQGSYGALSPGVTLSAILLKGMPLHAAGDVTKFTQGGREYYRIGLALDPQRAVTFGDALGVYLRGSYAKASSPVRSAQLAERYRFVKGTLVVDKLLQRPLALTLDANYDPSVVAFSGTVHLAVNFHFVNVSEPQKPQAQTLDEMKGAQADQAAINALAAQDAPVVSVLPIVATALQQFGEKFGRYPLSLSELVDGGFVGKDAMSPDVAARILFASYVARPVANGAAQRCAVDTPHCNFYHLAASLKYSKSPVLAGAAHFTSPAIIGGVTEGCRGEADMACYDLVGNLSK